jgi:hypothetical protein
VNDAVKQWLENREDAELVPVIEEARAEWKTKGGRSWSEVEQKMDKAVHLSIMKVLRPEL